MPSVYSLAVCDANTYSISIIYIRPYLVWYPLLGRNLGFYDPIRRNEPITRGYSVPVVVGDVELQSPYFGKLKRLAMEGLEHLFCIL